MQCMKCVHKTVCKHLSYMMENLHIGIQINDCKLYENELKENTIQSKVSCDSSPIKNGFIPPNDYSVDTLLLNNSSGYPDFSNLSSKADSIKAIPVEISKVTCDRCKKEVFSTDIDNCLECGRPVCLDCKVSTFDPTSGTVTSVCEKCWSGAEDPKPGEEAQVSISFEQDEDTWNIEDFIKEDTSKEEENKNVEGKQMDNTKSNRKSKKK